MSQADTLAKRAEIEAQIDGKTTGHFLLANSEKHGDEPAMSWRVGDDWQSLSWREYREQVAEIAMGLHALGLERGDYVALMICNRPEHIIADQGTVHAGATASTFYATLAPEQIEYAANNCKAKIAVLENREVLERWLKVRDKLEALETIVLLEDVDDYAHLDDVVGWDELRERGRKALADDPEKFEELWRAVEPDDPATLIYTSGTTGPPKGVLLTHRNCLYETVALNQLADLPSLYTCVSYLPIAHIAERLLSVYFPMWKAAHVYYCPDPKQAIEYLQKARPSLFFGVPRVWEKVRSKLTAKLEAESSAIKRTLGLAAINSGHQMVRFEQAGEIAPTLLRAKHAVLERLVLQGIRTKLGLDLCLLAASAAAPLPVDVSAFFAAIGVPILEVYGMTETTGVCSGNPRSRIKIGSVGPPLAGVEVRLAEDGEVLTRGPANTPGYLNRPEATAELIDEDGWIHTGDVGEVDDDGYLKIVDRKKELIVTAAGKNISPANLESLLKQHPLVGQALAFGDARPFVVALVVLDSEVAPAWAEQHDIPFESVSALAEHPKVVEAIETAVDDANQHVARVEQIKKHKILPAEWTADSEELTPTLKLKRRVIHAKYADEIEALYER